MGIDLEGLIARARSDREVVGGTYSTACYISDSWPSLLYLANKYLDALKAALLANTNLGGENAYRGAVLGGIIGLGCGRTVDEWLGQLLEHPAIESKIVALLTPR